MIIDEDFDLGSLGSGGRIKQRKLICEISGSKLFAAWGLSFSSS